jgi:Tfp pilus assembly protein PilF
MDQEQLEYKKIIALEQFQKAYEQQMEGKLEEAVTLYKKSIAMYPTAEAYTFLGWTYSFMGRYDDAIEECRKAIEVDPEYGNPYNDIGAYLIEKGRLDEAISWLEKATKAKRYENHCFPHLNLGRIWERKGEWSKAMEEYRLALKENPQYLLAARALKRLQAMSN